MNVNQIVKRLVILVATIMLSVSLSACSPDTQQTSVVDIAMTGSTMGTTYHIKVMTTEQKAEQQKLHQQIDKLLVEVNQHMSTYIPSSELSKFNQSNSTAPIKISAGMHRVVAEALRVGHLTDGALDITLGPVVNLWGFGPTHRPEIIPTPAAIASAREKVGLDKLTLTDTTLQKSVAGLYVDLSSTAKGYGVDRVAELLIELGYHNYLVEIGGEMRIQGHKADGQPWRVAIEKPISNERSVQQIIIPHDNGLATSGDYRIYFEENGHRYSHIIDPKTDEPITNKLVSVTVVNKSCMTADAFATSFMVMGTEKALAFAKAHNMAILTVTKTADGFKQQNTPQFNQYLVH